MKKLNIVSFFFLALLCMSSPSYSQVGACCSFDFPDSCRRISKDRCAETPGSRFLGQNVNCNQCDIGRCCEYRQDGSSTGMCFDENRFDCVKRRGTGLRYRFIKGKKCADEKCPATIPRNVAQDIPMQAIYREDSKDVQLTWSIAAEYGDLEFAVERSLDGENFKPIGIVQGNAAAGGRTLSFTDSYPLAAGYYQLSWSTPDGEFATSQIIAAISVARGRMVITSNPAVGDKAKVLLNNMQLYQTEVSVYDLSGRVQISQVLRNGQTELNISSLPKGTYIVRANQSGKTYTGKLIRN